VYNPSDKDKKIVDRFLSRFIGENVALYIIPEYDPKNIVEESNAVVTFGKIAYRMVKQTGMLVELLELPAPSVLLGKMKDPEENRKMVEEVERFKNRIGTLKGSSSLSEINIEALGEIDRNAVLAAVAKNEGEKRFIVTTRSGDLIEIAEDKQIQDSSHFTLNEILILKTISEVLDVKQITIQKGRER
jgi:hypothetical protein